jgi:hypothetical protein
MHYSCVEIEYVATSFSPVRMDLAVKLLNENCYAMTFGGDSLYVECTRYSCNILLIYIKVQ